ncbi:MAG: shikimate dehydrogenase [Proteobacteria bacterium]|nr:shikimate dehydrogenase [Pseudomonadota bacterium]NOG59859.1 shikimate dehydrogenase [Pseudomonadota bacterium]
MDSSLSNYAVFGNPINHSKSPQIHSLFAEQKGITLNYQAIEVPVDSFKDYVNSFVEQKGKGLNITVPFKGDAFSLCDILSDRADISGSVNTIWFDKDKNIYGDTTDGKGLINDLIINNEIDLNNKSILILGAGGSVRAILEPLCAQKPKQIVIANRTVSRAVQLAKIFSNHGNIQACSYADLSEKLYGQRSFDVIINGTSLSLNGRLPTIPKSTIGNTTCCYDLMYSDKETIFMKWASEQGAFKVLDGLGMLVEQAAEAFNIWHGVMPDTAPVIKQLRNVPV